MSSHSETLIFSRKLFDIKTNRHVKSAYSSYLGEMDGKTVDLEDKYEHGTVKLDDGDYVYPVYREWCGVKKEEQMELSELGG